jgi:hypothetical protein
MLAVVLILVADYQEFIPAKIAGNAVAAERKERGKERKHLAQAAQSGYA